jgi:hypothetical protein
VQHFRQFHPTSTKFILSFLSDRTQVVRINGSFSDYPRGTSGIYT